MTTSYTTEYVTGAETSKLIRKALREAFPCTKFRVRLAKGGGGATYINWTDGPTRQQVQGVTGEFESQSFDPMTDMRSYEPSLYANEDGSLVLKRYGSGLVIESRDWSAEVEFELIHKFSQMREGSTGELVSDQVAGDFAWREFAAMDFSKVTA